MIARRLAHNPAAGRDQQDSEALHAVTSWNAHLRIPRRDTRGRYKSYRQRARGSLSLPAHCRASPEQARMTDRDRGHCGRAATSASHVLFRCGRDSAVILSVPRFVEQAVDQAIFTQASSRFTSSAALTSFSSYGRTDGVANVEICRACRRDRRQELARRAPTAEREETRLNSKQAVRSAVEYQGQKCCAASRLHLPRSL